MTPREIHDAQVRMVKARESMCDDRTERHNAPYPRRVRPVGTTLVRPVPVERRAA